MKRGLISIVDRSPSAVSEEPPRLASWYAPGRSDALGDRLSMFDNTGASSLELLRFSRELAALPEFESAVAARLRRLAGVHHPSIAEIRALKWMDTGEGLALVSDHVDGRRLSEVLQTRGGPILAAELARQLAPALALLADASGGIGHGALTPDRVVLTPDGRFVMTEHPLGEALLSLGFPAARLAAEFSLVIPERDDHPAAWSIDVVQLGYVALSALLGRSFDAAGYLARAPLILEQFGRTPAGRSSKGAAMRGWLERTLPGAPDAFETARQAAEALEFGDRADPPRPTAPIPITTARRTSRLIAPVPRPETSPRPVARAVVVADEPPSVPRVRRAARPASIFELHVSDADHNAAPPTTDDASSQAEPIPEQASSRTSRRVITALVAMVVCQAVAIGWLVTRPTGSVRTALPPTTRTTPPPAAAGAAAKVPPSEVEKPGSLAITSPIAVRVIENGVVLGATPGAIALKPGRHTLEFVNSSHGYHVRRTVNILAGQITGLTLAH